MAKPWARLEIGYLSHPKFLALNANAICLWHEGKNYCDAHHTDGLIPRDALRMFRFRGRKALALLLASCGPKPDGTSYAPLWESHPIGYKMHDYLDHNDCRDEVLARLDDAEDVKALRRIANKERQAKYRAERKARIAALSVTPIVTPVTRDNERDSTRDVTRTCSTPTETETQTETSRVRTPATRPASLVGRRNLSAAWEGPRGIHVPQRQHDRFVALRNGNESELWDWYADVAEAFAYGARKGEEPGANMFKFWDARYEERWPAAGAKPKDAGPVYIKAHEHPEYAYLRDRIKAGQLS